MPANAGDIVVELKGRSRDFEESFLRADRETAKFQDRINRLKTDLTATQAQLANVKGAQSFSRQLGVMTVALRAFLASAAAIGTARLTKELFRIGAAAVETENKFDTVFGAMSGDVEAFADDFGRMAGLSEVAAKDLLATTGAIAQGMGFARKESAKFSQEILKVAGDLGSFNNLPTEDVAFRIQAALTGERESMKRLGVVITEAEVQQRAMNATGKTAAAQLTQQDKATATLAIITEKAGVAIGDLSRTQDSAANTARRVSAQLDDVTSTVAVGLLPALASLMNFLDRNLPAIEAWADRVALAFQKAFDPAAIGLEGFEEELDRQIQQMGPKSAAQLLPTQQNLEARRAKALAELRAIENKLEGFSAFDKLNRTLDFKNLGADAAIARAEIERVDRALSILSGKMIGIEHPGRGVPGFEPGIGSSPDGASAKALKQRMRLLGPATRGMGVIRRVPIEIEPYISNTTESVNRLFQAIEETLGREIPRTEGLEFDLPVTADLSFLDEPGGTLYEFRRGEELTQEFKQLGVNAGRELMRGLAEGTLSGGEFLRQTLLSVMDIFVTKSLEKLFQMASPSRVFMGYGENLMEGLALGIASSGQMVRRSVADIVPDVMPDSANTARATGPGHTVHMTNTFEIKNWDSRSVEQLFAQNAEVMTGHVVNTMRRSQGLRQVLDR